MPRQKWKKKIAFNQFYKLVYVLLDGKLKKEKVLFYRAVRQPQFSTRALVHHKFKKKKKNQSTWSEKKQSCCFERKNANRPETQMIFLNGKRE